MVLIGEAVIRPEPRAPPRSILLLLFLLSGGTGLVHEVAWTRLFTLVFGSTALAVSSVLAAFMAGLAIGARILGARADRRSDELRLYGFLEIGVGVTAVLILPALEVLGYLVTGIHRQWQPSFTTMSLVRFGLSFGLLLVPTAFMGGTLPILVRYWTRTRAGVGRSLGHLYAVNTLGAMIGCFAAGFFLIATLGVRGTVYLAAAGNIAIGIAALALGRRSLRAEAEVTAVVADASGSEGLTPVRGRFQTRLALAAISASGFLALAYEVAWTRVLLYVLSASVHAFTIMLTVFLGGLGVGSLLFAREVRDPAKGFRIFGLLEIGIGAAALSTIALLYRFPDIHDSLIILLRVESWNALALVKLVEAALVILVPTLLMGATFPIVSRLVTRDLEHVGRSVGTMLAVNTAGAVLGSFAAGFVLIPYLGTQLTITALAIASALLGGVLLLASCRTRPSPIRSVFALIPAAVILGVSFLLPERAFLPIFGINLRGGKISYYREGVTGTVTIHDSPGSRILSINGADVAGTSFMLRTTQKLQAHIPLLLHPDPREVLQVGLGSGETAHSILLHPEVRRLVGCDISPEVIEAGAHFRAINEEVYANPRLEIVIEDAKNYAKHTDRSFDLILNDSVHPIFRGSSDLYARDYFELCRTRLNEHGMMSSWFPIALLSEDDLRMLLRTFHEVFPTSSVWIATNGITRNALLLGWKDDEPLTIDFSRVTARIRGTPAIQNDLAEVQLFTPFLLLDSFMLDAAALEELTGDARINTYDRPHLEFSAPRVLARGDRLLWARNFETIVKRRQSILPYLINLAPDPEGERRVRERLAKRRAASAHVLEGLTHELAGRGQLAHRAYEEALSILPRDPIAGFLVAQAARLETALETQIAAGSEDAGHWYLLGRQRREEGRLEDAAELFTQAVEIRPEHVRAQLELAIVLRDLERLAPARQAIDRVIALDPRMAAAWAVRGSIAAAEGNLAEAEADLRKASEAGAALPWAELLLGRILTDRGALEEGREHLLAVVDLAPESTAAARARELLGAGTRTGSDP